jgi:hypothetical protein
MRRRHILINSALVALTLAIVSGCFFTQHVPQGPRYQGRTLTDWLGDFRPGPTELPAARAVIAIGTNGIPTMFKLLVAKDPGMRNRGSFGLVILGCNVPAAPALIEPRLRADMRSDDRELSERAKLILQGIQSRSDVFPH